MQREFQQPQGVSGRSCVEDDVIEFGGRASVAEKLGEFIERGDLDCAGAGKLFFHAGNGGFWQHTTIRSNHPFAVRSGPQLPDRR